MRTSFSTPVAVGVLGLAGLSLPGLAGAQAQNQNPADEARACDTAGLGLPDGFCATVFSAEAGEARHMAVHGDVVYANLANDLDGHGLMALRDRDGDGVADERATFGSGGGTGLAVHDGWLYAASLTEIRRYELTDALTPAGDGELVVSGMPEQESHAARGLAIGADGELFVNIGAPSNACQAQDRVPGSEGQDPCPLLERYSGVWRFDADTTGQTFSPQARYASGMRNMLALDVHDGQLYGVQHGRDQLDSTWPELFSAEDNARLPAEELFAIDSGDDFGWPYCYYDPDAEQKVLAPEYGGDGETVGRCSDFEDPIAAYPAHWAPMDLVFYDGDAFGRDYRGGAFIAFHGSWNRAPLPQAGYRVIFQPFEDGEALETWQDFADAEGFTGQESVGSPGSAEHRPAGLAVGPDGALYISSTTSRTIFRVTPAD